MSDKSGRFAFLKRLNGPTWGFSVCDSLFYERLSFGGRGERELLGIRKSGGAEGKERERES